MIQHGFEDDDHNIKRWQRFKHSSFDLCYHLEARPGIGTSPGCFSSSGSPLGGKDPTGDCPGEREYHPGGVVGPSGVLLPHHHEARPH